MTTNIFIEQDLAAKKANRGRVVAQSFSDLHGSSEPHLREKLRECDQADRELEGLKRQAAIYQNEKDSAVSRHQNITAPLQLIVNDERTSIAEKIEAHAGIIAANLELETEVDRLDKLLEACRQEIEIASIGSGMRLVVENAFTRCGSDAEKERVWTLNKALNILETYVCHATAKKANDLRSEADHVRQKQKQLESDGSRAAKSCQGAVDESDLVASRAEAVHSLFARFRNELRDQLSAMRDTRLAKLYE